MHSAFFAECVFLRENYEKNNIGAVRTFARIVCGCFGRGIPGAAIYEGNCECGAFENSSYKSYARNRHLTVGARLYALFPR